MLRRCTYDSPIGRLVLMAEGDCLLSLTVSAEAACSGSPLQPFCSWLDRYFAGEGIDSLGLKLAPQGTPFQQRVWASARKIPYGNTTTYGALAAALGSSPRAVGAALGRNPILLMIPCHRIISRSGALTGFAAGLPRKQWLLEHEQPQGVSLRLR